MEIKGIVYVAALLLIVSVLSSLPPVSSGNDETGLVLVFIDGTQELEQIYSLDTEVIETYCGYVLLRADRATISIMEKMGLYVDRMEERSVLYVKGHRFDINNGLPDLPARFTLDGYESGTMGLYIVHMLGPVTPGWRTTLEDEGVQIVNYIPNYAYKVLMTPETADHIQRLYFVDWVGIYQPAFKIAHDITPGMVYIDTVPGGEDRVFDALSRDSIEVISGSGTNILVDAPDLVTLTGISLLPEVVFVYPYHERTLTSEMESQIIGGYWDPGAPSTPYRGEGDWGAYVNQLGYTGAGVVCGVADTGLGDGTIGDAGHPDFTGRVVGGKYWTGTGWQDGHGHGTHCAGSMAGDTYGGTGIEYAGHGPYYVGQGLASGAGIYMQKVFSDGGSWIGPPEDYDILFDAKVGSDAYVHSNSWGYGYSGVYFTTDSHYDRAARDSNPYGWGNDGMVITAAAGNAGPGERTIGSPGNAKNVIAVGATGTYMPDATSYGGSVNSSDPYTVVDFSSRGWTEDNRVKPDLVAPGRAVLSTRSPLASGGNVYTPDNRYEWMSGTSMATPLVAGGAAVVVEYYEDVHGSRPSPAMVKALLINTAVETGNHGSIPNRHEGWGMVNLPDIVDRMVSVIIRDQESLLTTGDLDEFQVHADSLNEPLKITLGWTDKYAHRYDNPTLKNDLNLEVIAPGGDTYRGNAFSGGWTPPNTGAMGDFDSNGNGWDDSNNLENVFIHPDNLETGVYTVRVRGYNIPEDALLDGFPSQDYALIIQNAKPHLPSVRTDRELYSTEDTIKVTVEDIGYEGHQNLDVNVYSDTDPVGLSLQLTPDTQSWQFTGSLAISDGTSPGVLTVSHGDQVTVEHGIYTKAVSIDGMGPSVEDMELFTALAVAVEWTTDKPCWSRLDFSGLSQEGRAYSNEFGSEHSVIIDGLVPGGTYRYRIVSIDLAGNVDHDDYRYFTVSTTDHVEYGNMGWTPDTRWAVRDHSSYSGDFSWNCGDGNYGTYWDEKLVTPAIDTSLWDDATISWWHSYEFDYRYDGGHVEVFHGGSWVSLVPEGGYDAVLWNSENVLSGRAAFTGDSGGWIQSQADLTPYLGSSELRVRFWVGTDEYSNWPDPREGWHIDDISITGTGVTPPGIELIQPNGGETLTYGTDYEITWFTTPGSGQITVVDLWYSVNEGNDWIHIESMSDTGSYWWSVPNENSNKCMVRASVYDEDGFTGTDVSDGTFTITGSVPPSITITAPTGGETWYAETNENIQWTTTPGDGTITGVDIHFSTNAGSSWTPVAVDIADTGSYSWQVPDVHTTRARIRLTVRDEHGTSDTTSSGNFDVVGIPAAAPTNLVVEHHGELEEPVTETRYMRGIPDEVTVNGLTAYSFATAQSDNGVSASSLGSNLDIYAGIRVWVRDETGMETEVSPGTAVGIAYRSAATGEGMVAGTSWTPPATALDETDSVVIRLYQGTSSPPSSLVGVFTTEQLGALGLDSEPWTPHYYLQSRGWLYGGTRVSWGSGTYNTRVENFQYVVPGSGDETEDNRLTWDGSPDDPSKVTSYNIYRSEHMTGPWTLIATVDSDGSPSYQYVDPGKGTGDEVLWWYTVFSDWSGYQGEGTAPVQEPPGAPVETFDIPLYAGGDADGWNFVSFNLVPLDATLESLLENVTYGISGSYDRLMYYDAETGEWLSYVPGRPDHFNNLHSWNHRMGIWIRMTTADTLTVEGYVPTSTDITLHPGWNMVSLPSESAGNHGLPSEVTKIGYFDAAEEYNLVYTEDVDVFEFQPGQGYWVYNEASHSVIWTVGY